MATASSDIKVIAKGTFWSLSGSFILRFLSFLYTIIVARLFSQDDVGAFYLAVSIFYAIAIFSDLGMNLSFSRYVPFYIGRGEKQKSYVLLQAAYVYCGILTLLLSVVIFLSAPFLAEFFNNPGLVDPIRWVALLPPLATFSALNISFISGLKMVKETSIMNNIQNIVKIGLTFFLIFVIGANATNLMISFVGSFAVLAALSTVYLSRGMKTHGISQAPSTLSEKTALLKDAASLGIAFAIVSEVSALAFYTDRFMLGYLLPAETSAETIAIYSMAVSLALMIQVFPNAIFAIFGPVMAELYGKGDKGRMAETAGTAVRWDIFLLVPMAMIFLVFPGQILRIFYGAAYEPGAAVLAIFTFGCFIRFLSSIHGTILASMRIVRVELYVGVLSLGLNLILNYLMIPVYGMDGAAAASALSMVIASVLIVYYCKKIFGFSFLGQMAKPVLGGALTLLILFLARGFFEDFMNLGSGLPLPVEGLAGLVAQKVLKIFLLGVLFLITSGIYFLCLFLLREFRENDIAILSGFLRRVGAPNQVVVIGERIMGLGSS